MENLFYEDGFYSELGDLLDELEIYEDTISETPDDFVIKCCGSKKEPLFELTQDWILERIDEERFPEDHDITETRLNSALKLIDYDKVNGEMPMLMYPNLKDKIVITKAMILEHFK